MFDITGKIHSGLINRNNYSGFGEPTWGSTFMSFVKRCEPIQKN